jgi:hypothetical protein
MAELRPFINAPSSPGSCGLSVRAELDGLISAFYAAFDNRGGRAPAIDALTKLFLPEARITCVALGITQCWSVAEFIAPRATMLTDGTLVEFHEWETESQTRILGSIASRESHYSKEGLLRGEIYVGQGRKFIQVCRYGLRWRIAAVLWEDYDRRHQGPIIQRT